MFSKCVSSVRQHYSFCELEALKSQEPGITLMAEVNPNTQCIRLFRVWTSLYNRREKSQPVFLFGGRVRCAMEFTEECILEMVPPSTKLLADEGLSLRAHTCLQLPSLVADKGARRTIVRSVNVQSGPNTKPLSFVFPDKGPPSGPFDSRRIKSSSR